MKKRALAVLLALSMAFSSPAYLSAAEQDGEPSVKQEEAEGEDPSDSESGKGQTDEDGNTDAGEGSKGESGDGTGSVKGEEVQDPQQPENDLPGGETENTVTEEELSAPVQTESVTPGEEKGQDPESLFSAYVDNAFNGNGDPAQKRLLKGAGPWMTGLKLTGSNKVIYKKIASELPAIAAGKQASTIFTVPSESLGRWSAEDLGVDNVMGTGGVTDEAYNAFRKNTDVNLNLIISALLADYPYHLYWYDKTASTSCSRYSIYYELNNETHEYELYIKDDLKIYFPVSVDFADADEKYVVDTSTGQSVQKAVKNANSIVEEFKNASDEEKLYGFKERICELVSYNKEAAKGGVSYGDPWQLIWVFDDDPDTKVVCEGYAKAFKYLCDQSSFAGDIRCITVSGTMSVDNEGGRHMWNVVLMDDGNNYLADLTNCDGDSESYYTIGYKNLLFMTKEATGDTEKGYKFQCNDSVVSYVYDTRMSQIYSESELVIGQRTEKAARILAASVSFRSTIGLNYYIDIPDEYLEDSNVYIEYTINKLTPESGTVPLCEIPTAEYDGSLCRKLTVDTVVKSIHDQITLNIYDGEGNKLPLHLASDTDITQSGFKYSVADYCADIQKQSSNEAMKELAYKLEQYGLYVQKYLNYKADKAAPELDVSSVTADSLNAFEGSYTDDLEGLAYYGFSFLFKEASALRFKFTLSDGYNIDDYRFTVDGTEVKPSFNGSQYVIQVSGIRARDLGRAYVVKVTDQEGKTQELNNSGISYAKALIERGSSGAGRDAARAMYLYYMAAENYFENR